MSATAELIKAEIEQANPVLAGKPRWHGLPDPSETPDLFRLNGIRPKQRENGAVYRDGVVNECCVLSAILVNRTTTHELHATAPNGVIRSRERADILGLPIEFSDGAQDGFDGAPLYHGEDYSPDYRDGHAYGKACLEACKAAGLMDEEPA